MKLQNRQQNNFFEVDDAIMRGTITMTEKELSKVFNYLTKILKTTKDTYIKDSLSLLQNKKYTAKNINMFCLGVTATKLIVEKYKLQNYKDINYAIIIK